MIHVPSVIAQMKKMTRCALCGYSEIKKKTKEREKNSEKDNTSSIIIAQKGLFVIHGTCQKCGVATLTFLSEKKGGAVGFGVASDLQGDEAAEVLQSGRVTAEDVLACYMHSQKQ